VFGSCSVVADSGERYIDVSTLLLNLVLFDTYIMQSSRLEEIPRLIELFDYSGLRQLIKVGALRFDTTPVEAVNVDKHIPGSKPTDSALFLNFNESQTATTRPGSYQITVVRLGVPEIEVPKMLSVIDEVGGLSTNRRNRLRDSVEGAVTEVDKGLWEGATSQTHMELDRLTVDIREAVSRCLLDGNGQVLPPEAVQIKIHREDDTNIFVESNLTQYGLDPMTIHRVVGNALLSLTRCNARLGYMQMYSAVTGMPREEMVFLDRKLAFVLNSVLPDEHLANYRKVITCAGLPLIEEGVNQSAVGVDRLLDVRSSKACREFRAWLRDVDGDTAEEAVKTLMKPLSRIGATLGSPGGRSLRFAAVSAVGALTTTLPPIGLALGAFDSFVLQRILPSSGPITFLSRLYPSMFVEGRM
jgi:hypothetical protein